MNSAVNKRFEMMVWLILLMALSGIKPLQAADKVWVATIHGAVSPASADYFVRTLQRAENEQISLLVLKLDTPGGLDASMRQIIKAILASKVPVATYVAPSGSRAASAGTYILYASHIAAMAPATNVGSSTPVTMRPAGMPQQQEDEEQSSQQSSMEKKLINDAVAYIRGLAELRGRNADWAEETVREAVSLSATDALEQGVTDFIATDLNNLLEQLDGHTVTLDAGEVVLQLANTEVTEIETGWRYDLLSLITDPNVAYLLLMIGIYGLILEFYNPGVGIAGVVGVISLLLAGFALHMLPVNYAGLALLVVGMALMIGEAFSPSFGILGIGGLIAFVVGSIFLMDSDLPAYQISMPLIFALAASSFAIFVFVVGAALKARQSRIVSGQEAIIGSVAEALADFQGPGRVMATGEHWLAESTQPVKRGQKLRITGIDGLILRVEPDEE
ncbi:NfeD family protein [Methylophaga lonarensis]|uniref:NfeD family protein n=1 Tax=Methylophaga lonarensis TaxID=999151 RepID=UPI003D2E0751